MHESRPARDMILSVSTTMCSLIYCLQGQSYLNLVTQYSSFHVVSVIITVDYLTVGGNRPNREHIHQIKTNASICVDTTSSPVLHTLLTKKLVKLLGVQKGEKKQTIAFFFLSVQTFPLMIAKPAVLNPFE